jgi:hypothetical protein
MQRKSSSAKDELLHLAESLSEDEAERVLETLRREMPELYGESPDACKTYPVRSGDGQIVRVTIPIQ